MSIGKPRPNVVVALLVHLLSSSSPGSGLHPLHAVASNEANANAANARMNENLEGAKSKSKSKSSVTTRRMSGDIPLDNEAGAASSSILSAAAVHSAYGLIDDPLANDIASASESNSDSLSRGLFDTSEHDLNDPLDASLQPPDFYDDVDMDYGTEVEVEVDESDPAYSDDYGYYAYDYHGSQPLDESHAEEDATDNDNGNLTVLEFVNIDAAMAAAAKPPPADSRSRSRSLSAETYRFGTFGRLACNPDAFTDCSTLVSDRMPAAGQPLEVPCGQCWTFDLTGNVTSLIDNGINIRGKLLFPFNHKATIYTPFVIVQGELEIMSMQQTVSPDNESVRIILVGTGGTDNPDDDDDILFRPVDAPNTNACANFDNNMCNLGKKPFVVAGGKLNIRGGLPSNPFNNCKPYAKIKSKSYTDPVYNTSNFATYASLTPFCQNLDPSSSSSESSQIFERSIVSHDFTNGDYGNWTGRYGTFVVAEDGSSTMKVTNRRLTDQGPAIDLTPLHPELCMVPDQKYLFVAKMKFDMPDGSMDGTPTSCKANSTYCPELEFIFRNVNSHERWYEKGRVHKHIAPNYGEYFYFTSSFHFGEEALSPDNAYFYMLIHKVNAGVDITIDSFDLFLPSKSSYPDPDDVCGELVLNGNAEGNGFNPYPMDVNRHDERIIIMENDKGTNRYWRYANRYYWWSSIRFKFPNYECFTQGVTYFLSARMRLTTSGDFVGGVEPYYWYIWFRRNSDNRSIERKIVDCPGQSVDDGWVTCSGEFMVDVEMADAHDMYLLMKLYNSRDGKYYDLEYDDISILYQHGYVTDLVVDSEDASCWGEGSDAHVTSSTYYSEYSVLPNGYNAQIDAIVDNGDGTTTICLDEAPVIPIITEEENIDYAAEIALLTRNIKIEGHDDGQSRKGGYLQVIHTPGIAQTIEGVEFFNMGRKSEKDRNPLQLAYSGNIEGTLISGNSFHESNYRCVSIEGTSNVTVSYNVGHKTIGHCIYVGYESQDNLITKNLVSDTKSLGWGDRVSGESDNYAGAFLNWYHPNDFVDNIAVSAYRYGFVFVNDYRTRAENNTWISGSVRRMKFGAFSGNVAKSNWYHGFHFNYLESGEETLFTGIKAIKNRERGLYVYSGWNLTIQDSLLSENAYADADLRWIDNVEISDTIFRGYTKETKAMTKPPYFNKPCISNHFRWGHIGFRSMMNIHRFNTKDNIGANLNNVLFTDFDHTDECEEATPIGFNTGDIHSSRSNDFDYLTMFQNVTVDGLKIMDATKPAEERDVRNIVIHDIDGSSNPSGQESSSGMFVSNVRYLKAFSGQPCQNYLQGISYCPESCYRTVNFFVDQVLSKDVDLKITRLSDGEQALVPFLYNYDDEPHRILYNENTRRFSVSLPEGNYRAEFVSGLDTTWPKFTLPEWEGTPSCDGHLSRSNLTFFEPPDTCDSLTINEDMEQGTYGWYHRTSSSNTNNGEMLAVKEGIDGSTALRYYNRTSGYNGIGQNLDMRCVRENLNEFYEIELYFRLENGTTPFICNPYSSSWSDRCPFVTFGKHKYNYDYNPNYGRLESTYQHHRANVIHPNNLGPLNLVHGVIKITEELASFDRIFMYLEYTHNDFDMIVDNFSVKRIPGICGKDLLRNGNFEENGKFWRIYGSVNIDIEETSGDKSMKVFNKGHPDNGIYQDLYIDQECFNEDDRYEIFGKFRIESASNGTSYECDRTTGGGELECNYGYMWSQSELGDTQPWIGETVAVARDVYDGWNIMSGIMTVNEKQVDHSRMYFRLSGSHDDMNVYFDDYSITPIPKTCENLVLNGDFETGDSRLWRPTYRYHIDFDIHNQGADSSQYSLVIQQYTGHSVRQNLDTRCLIEGQEFLITAKHRLLNATDLSLGVECEPSILNLGDRRHCPTTHVRGENCNGTNLEYTFWNEVDQFTWNPDAFNPYEAVFTVGPEMATCKAVYIALGRYDAHNGRHLVIDDVQISQRTTLPPTSSPTFSPTKGQNSGPTSAPTVKTPAPTTTNVLACPPTDSDPLVVNSGTFMIQYAENTLCTLTKATTLASGEISLTPIALSYDNYPWERAPGEYAASLFKGEEILCYTAGCQIKLPPLEAEAEYHLSSYSYSLSDTNKYARFLETATFGTTEDQLNAFELSPDSVEDDISAWVSAQMDSDLVPITSHREFWRKGINGRLPTSRPMGTPDHPCDLYSRWRKVSFIRNDNQWWLSGNMRIIQNAAGFRFTVDGFTRTATSTLTIGNEGYQNYTFDPTFGYELCGTPEERIDGRLYIRLENESCVWTQNPAVSLDGFENTVAAGNIFNLPDGSLEPIDQWWSGGEELVYVLNLSLFDDPSFSSACGGLPSLPERGDEPVFGKLSDGTWLIFDSRLDLETNTLDSPIPDGGKTNLVNSGGDTSCSNVPRTFLNDDQCQVSSNACRPSSNTQVEIQLDNSTISDLNNLTDHYVYAIKGLLVKNSGINLEHPCTPGLRSRWEPKNVTLCNPTELYSLTNETLFNLLSRSGDRNPYIRDIQFPNQGTFCNSSDTEPEIEIEVDGECWKRVHDEHMSIYDMTYWVYKHNGGQYAIQKWSLNNGTYLIYPSLLQGNPHSMSRWNNNMQKFSYLGRFGDRLRLGDLPNDLRQDEVMNYFNPSNDENSKILVCGSPGEISNDKSEDFTFDARTGYSTVGWDITNNRKYVWIMIALSSPDQLRQRVSWALSQILVVVKDAIGRQGGNTEWFVQYYDIFVRNAFGNYRDILREVSYNALMAENLSFLGSKSSSYMLERYNIKTSADENFAREIMQLFTMGLVQLNMDGSPKVDVNGYTALAYTNDDIESFSRAWTGFDLQPTRSNIEGDNNRIDPMKIVPEWRDKFPKSHTTGGYIGDSYPLCSDFPSKAFLRKGATYRFLGSSSLPELMDDSYVHGAGDAFVEVVLDEASSLRSLLCNEDQDGNCDYQTTVALTTNYVCTGIECEVDTVRVVQVAPDAYYEFVHQPCTSFSFYNNAVKISPRYSTDKVMCADPTLPVANEACCSFGSVYATRNSRYSGERVTFATAGSRCDEVSKDICDFYHVTGNSYLNGGYFWTADSCQLRVKIRRDGAIAIVHHSSGSYQQVLHVDEDNGNYFKVFWQRGGDYPTVDSNCDSVCEVLPEGSCLCGTGVLETSVFDAMPSGVSEAMDKLSIGGVDPSSFDLGTYSAVVDADSSITAYLKNNEFNAETLFEFYDDNGRYFLFKNCKNSVYLRGIDSGFTGQSFRNTPQFMSFIPSEANLRDAQYETEAVLDHYFFHPNTAPFLALRLIQRLVTSNPAPRYVETVAEAFKNGHYASGDLTFGSGEYGDLAATFAAIYLDRAARNVLVDADIASGAIREPILKVLALMKNMGFVSPSPVTVMNRLLSSIGQMAHEFTSVFSFFLPEHKPAGRLEYAALVSPEATLLDMPKVIGLLNGLTSMVKYGMSSCRGGYGISCREAVYSTSSYGRLEFNKTSTEQEFSFETFEGPSLRGGLDNRWVGSHFNHHNARVTANPVPTNSDAVPGNDHVLHLTTTSWNGDFFSPPIRNLDADGNPYAVKFRFYSTQDRSGGCIGYVDASSTSLNYQSWQRCDDWNMQSNGGWISCQFVVPAEVESFRIVVGDRRSPAGDAFFDDIQLASGSESTCSGIDVPKNIPPGQAGYSNAVVDRLSTLLTAGRLSNDAKDIIIEAFDNEGSAEDGLRIAQQIIITTSEFHTASTLKSTNELRTTSTFSTGENKPYKAVVYLMLNGGCDSYNMLMPYTCSNGLYESYVDVRLQVAIAKNRLLPISAENQVCTEFGLHPSFPAVQDLYNGGDMMFFANSGVMSQPVNKDNYYRLTNVQLFAHNHMQRESKTIDPYDVSSGTGVLGRMADVLNREGKNVGSFSVDRFSVALMGKPGGSKSPMIVDRNGVPQVYLEDTKGIFPKLHNISSIDGNMISDTWSSAMMDSVNNNELLRNELQGVTTQTEFPNSYLANTLETVSRLIATREARGVDVDTFYIETGGFDTHSDVEERLSMLLGGINAAFDAFSQEMKAVNLWNNVTLIQTSDFARTLNPNGGDGTDHAWGGNHMMMGGSVKGGQILGTYPDAITDDDPLALSRGRMIPTTPWDTIFSGIATWLGIGPSDMDEVCPNLYRFNSSYLIDAEDMFSELPPLPSMMPSTSISTSPSMSPSSSASPTEEESASPTSAPVPVTPAPVSSTPAPVPATSAPSSAPVDCTDRTGKWTIGGSTRNWCTWAAKYGDAELVTRCQNKNLYNDCPRTCRIDACLNATPAPVPVTPAPVKATPAPVKATPAPVKATAAPSEATAAPATLAPVGGCADRTGLWTIDGLRQNWCTWAGTKNTGTRCTNKNLFGDCPVTCDSCPETPAPVPSTTPCADRTDKWTIDGLRQNWCTWAGGKNTGTRCTNKNLFGDCPVTCGSCPTTPAPVSSSTPAPVGSSCTDKTGKWTIGTITQNWCTWAGSKSTATRCSNKDLYADCPVTCDRCPSTTPAPAPSTTPCADKTGKWTIDGLRQNWCTWAGGKNTGTRCTNKNLFGDCPVTCGSCP